MKMLQSDKAELLVYYQPLEYSGCWSSMKCDIFSFSEVLEGILVVNE